MGMFRQGALLVLVGMLIPPAIPTQAADYLIGGGGATQQVESGAKKVGQGEVGKGVEETARVSETRWSRGAKFTGEKFKGGRQRPLKPAKQTGENIKEGLKAFRAERDELLYLFVQQLTPALRPQLGPR